MFYNPKFYYEDNAGEGGGNGGENNGGEGGSLQKVESFLSKDELKSYGVETKEQLFAVLSQHKDSQVSAAEKERIEEGKKADFIKYSAENGLLKVEDVNTYETILKKSDIDLALERHTEEWREDNPEVTEPSEISDQAKADFQEKYNLNSENAKQKARGEERIKKQAADLRTPISSKYKAAEASYQECKAMEGKIPEFNKAVSDLITECTPDKLVIGKVKEGDSEVPIEVELTKKEREELTKSLVTPKMFQRFTNSKDLSEFKNSAAKRINGILKEKYFDAAIEKSYTAGKGIGTTQGSNVGAEQPFAIVRDISGPRSASERSDGDKAVMDNDMEMRKRINSGR